MNPLPPARTPVQYPLPGALALPGHLMLAALPLDLGLVPMQSIATRMGPMLYRCSRARHQLSLKTLWDKHYRARLNFLTEGLKPLLLKH